MTTKKITNVIKTVSTGIMGISILSTAIGFGVIQTQADWGDAAHQADNANCTGANPTQPCRSLARSAGPDNIWGTGDDTWGSSDRSLNVDSKYTYELDNPWTGPTFTNDVKAQKMSPGVANDGFFFCATNMHTNIATRVTDAAATADCNNEVLKRDSGTGSKVLAYGPYLDNLSVDTWYQADFKIKAENLTGSPDDPTIRVDAVSFPGGVREYSIIKQSEITNSDYNTYSLVFLNKSPKSLELRVFAYDTADVSIESITVSPTTEPVETSWTFNVPDYNTGFCGSRVFDPALNRNTSVATTSPCNLQLGQYSREIASQTGNYEAIFYFKKDGSVIDSQDAVYADIFNYAKGRLGAARYQGSAITTVGDYEALTVNFSVDSNDGGALEFRSWGLQPGITYDRTVVNKL